MKAFIMAAGKGTRLKPYTDTCPKCMMDINGKPLLQIWLENLEKAGIKEVLINTNHLAEKVENFLKSHKTSLKIKISREEKLLGSAGTLKANENFIENNESFLIVYADNLTNTDLNALIDFHMDNKSRKDFLLTMGLFETSRPKECGIAELNSHGEIVSFIEKPENPQSNLANAGIYVCEKKIFDFLDKKDKELLDIGLDLLPMLDKKMLGMKLGGFIKDIGSIKNYEESLKIWKELNKDECQKFC